MFKSTNAGVTWTPIFGNYGSASIGDVCVNQKNRTSSGWALARGCGRNSRRPGATDLESTDGGKTFTHGLKDSFNIRTILLHPTEPQHRLCVGDRRHLQAGRRSRLLQDDRWRQDVDGAVEQPAGERRLDRRDRSADGSVEPNTIYVGFWERKRTAFNLDSGGARRALQDIDRRRQDLQKLTKGLPTGKTGKIGIAVARSNEGRDGAHRGQIASPRRTPGFADISKIGAVSTARRTGGETWPVQRTATPPALLLQPRRDQPFNDRTRPLRHLLRSHHGRRQDVRRPAVAVVKVWRWRRRRRRVDRRKGSRHALLARDLARPAQQEAVLDRQRRRPRADARRRRDLRFENLSVTQCVRRRRRHA